MILIFRSVVHQFPLRAWLCSGDLFKKRNINKIVTTAAKQKTFKQLMEKNYRYYALTFDHYSIKLSSEALLVYFLNLFFCQKTSVQGVLFAYDKHFAFTDPLYWRKFSFLKSKFFVGEVFLFKFHFCYFLNHFLKRKVLIFHTNIHLWLRMPFL